MGKKKGVLSYEIGNEETMRVTERERERGRGGGEGDGNGERGTWN